MREKWIRINTIEEYEDVKDCYWISNSDEDKIMNRNTGKILKTGLDTHGYLLVKLITNQGKMKNYRIHTLKVKAFIYTPNPLGYNVVRHLNDVKTDNALTNLAWGTQSDNMKDCIRNGHYNYETAVKNCAKNGTITGAKNGKKSSKFIKCRETGIIYSNAYEASRQLGIDRANINCCCNGKRKTAGGFHFEFVDQRS